MADHYQLDVDPAALRQVQRRYAAAAEALGGRATKVRDTPGEIGDSWLGTAATSVKGEMGTVAGLLVAYQGHLESAADALGTLAGAYEDALEAIDRLNRRRTDAEGDAARELGQLDTMYEKDRTGLTEGGRRSNRFEQEELRETYAFKRSGVTGERDRILGRLDGQYEALVTQCRQATSTCSGKLKNAVHVKVPEDIALNLSDPRAAQGAYLAMYDAAEEALGDELTLLRGLDEADDAGKQADADRVPELLGRFATNTAEDREQLIELLRTYQGDPEFAGMVAAQIDPDVLGMWLAQAAEIEPGNTMDPDASADELEASYLELVKGLGQTYGLATQVQGDYKLPDDIADKWYEAMTDSVNDRERDWWPNKNIVLASLMTQGGWDPRLLSDLTGRMIAFERDSHQPGYQFWEHLNYNGRGQVPTPDGYTTDPIAVLMTAVARNHSAAQTLFTEGGTRTVEVDGKKVPVNDVLAYLLMDREWIPAETERLTAALTQATAEKPGDQVPGRIVEDLQSIIAHGEELQAKYEAEQKANDKPWYVDVGHFVLDLGGLIPLVGEIADLINAGWYELEGDHVNAGLSAAGAIPFAGWAATGGKLTLKGLKGVVSPELYAKLSRQLEDLADRGATFNVQMLNGETLVQVQFKNADELAAALKSPQPNMIYQQGDLIFYTDAKGVVTVGGQGGMRRFMALGEHFKHLPAGTQLRYAGHTFKVADNGALELVTVSRWKPIWGHGEAFNAQNWHRYTHNEIYLANGKRLDSYEPGQWIVERKYRQYADLKDPTRLRKDIDLLLDQYPVGELIPRTPGNVANFGDQAGKPLTGKPMLEIPPQTGALDPAILAYARKQKVTIRDTDGKIYTPDHPEGRLP